MVLIRTRSKGVAGTGRWPLVHGETGSMMSVRSPNPNAPVSPAVPWAPPALDALDPAALGDLLTRDPAPEFLLLGTGPTLRRPSPAFIAALEAQGIGVEIMDSRAAARAWGVLRAEGREIVCGLLPL